MNKKEFMKKYNMCEITKEDGFTLDIKYATTDNFTGVVLYEEPICLLRKNTAKKLIEANKKFNKYGYHIKIWDAFRPIKDQERMWNVFPDERFVANPKKGKSNHCKGSAVDVTLCDEKGKELKMPTEFDHFGKESYREYFKNLDDETRKNVVLLENIMKESGFDPFLYEWWHFNDKDKYNIIYEFYQ